MTENTTELPPQTFADEMHELQFRQLNKLIVTRNDLVGRFNAASGDRLTLTEQIRDNSQDPEIVAAREAWAEAEMKLHALVTPQVDKIIADSQGSRDEIETSIKELDAKLKPGLTYFKKMYGETSAKYFTKQERVQGAIRASGGKRVRGFNVVVTIDGEPREFDNAAQAAKFIGGEVETTDLTNAFFQKSGVEAAKDAPDSVSFTLEFTEVDADGNKSEKEAFVKFYRDGAATDNEDSTEDAPVEVADEDDLANF